MSGYTTGDRVRDLLADPAARSVVERYLPGIGEDEWVRTTPGLRLSLLILVGWGATSDLSRMSALSEELAALERHDYAEEVEEPWPAPRSDYEPDDVVRGSASFVVPDRASAYRMVEVAFSGPAHGNPFLEVELAAQVAAPAGSAVGDHQVSGFYDGDGTYRVRFLPDVAGRWVLTTVSNTRSLDGIELVVEVERARESDHGPVRADGFGFRHADGTRFLPLGTTCYAWTHQGDALEEQTLATLASAPWSKLRMCVFPKSMPYNENEPERYPFEFTDAEGPAVGVMKDGRRYDKQCYNPDYFRHLEHRIEQLAELGMDADLILFHPYDRWGYSVLGRESDQHYLRYVVARLAAFPNVWWSMANEYDLMVKSDGDWHRLGRLVRDLDPYGHPRSIHQCVTFFDHSADWITHASLQKTDAYKTAENTDAWRREWGKAVVIDEMSYEGNLPYGWGNITGEELVRRHWEAACRGGWGGHGETFLDPDDVIWWAKGGVLKGDSPARIGFLREVLADAPGDLEPRPAGGLVCGGAGDDYLLYYTSFMQPAQAQLRLPPGEWRLEILDTWAMTVQPVPGTHTGTATVELPGRPYVAIRARRLGTATP